MKAPAIPEKTDYRHPPKARIFCGLIYNQQIDITRIFNTLEKQWGTIDFVSRSFPFIYTRYYEKEMGPDLLRKFLCFENFIEQDALPALKWAAKRLEQTEMHPSGGRKVNIDPGLLLPDKLVLATTKSCTHRPYLGQGIYADLTLIYQSKSYKPLPWTYPDYAAEEIIQMFNDLRKRLGPGD